MIILSVVIANTHSHAARLIIVVSHFANRRCRRLVIIIVISPFSSSRPDSDGFRVGVRLGRAIRRQITRDREECGRVLSPAARVHGCLGRCLRVTCRRKQKTKKSNGDIFNGSCARRTPVFYKTSGVPAPSVNTFRFR